MAWAKTGVGLTGVYYEDAGGAGTVPYGGLSHGQGYAHGSAEDPMAGESLENDRYFGIWAYIKGRQDPESVTNTQYGDPGDYTALRTWEINWGDVDDTKTTTAYFTYPVTEELVNLTIEGVTLTSAQYTTDNFNLTHDRVNIPDATFNTVWNDSLCQVSLYTEPYDYRFGFSAPYYENGTVYPDPVEITAHYTSENVVFNTSSGGITHASDDLPIMFSWDLGGGYSRRIYPIASENYTVTIPEDTFAAYTFDIRDYTLSVETEGGYLEAWRTINGTDTLIERNEIKDAIDDVSLNLVTNRVYRIRIRLADGTVYDFGYFTPGVDTERTLIIDDLEYDDYAHVFTKHITVEAYRLNATYLQANYEDTRGDTTSIYVEISIRNGAQVYNTTVAAATAQVNWYSGVDYVSYVVLVNATHPSYRNGVVYSRTFSGEETHPDLPDFNIMGLTTRLFCTGIVLLVGVTVSGDKPEAGLFVATSVAAAFVYYGVEMLTWSDITVLYVIAVGIGLGGRVR